MIVQFTHQDSSFVSHVILQKEVAKLTAHSTNLLIIFCYNKRVFSLISLQENYLDSSDPKQKLRKRLFL